MLMRAFRDKVPTTVAWLLAWCALFLGGCADGPVPETRVLNPWIRKQWAEDERRVTTYHRKVADLAELRKKASTMPQAERDETAAHLAARLHEEKSPAMRYEFVRTLAEFATPVAQQAVAATVTDEDPQVRVLACRALGKQPSEEGFQVLSRLVVDDTDLDVRIAAASELGKFQAFNASQALRAVLDARDPALQLAAMQSLENLEGHREYRKNVAVWREHLDGGQPTPPPPPSIAEVVKQYWSWF
jgi:hypothetical protein